MRLQTLALLTTSAVLALGGCQRAINAYADRLHGPPDPYFNAPAQGDGGVPDGGFADIGYAAWNDSEPAYRLYPGDELVMVIPSAPEYNTTSTVQQDGRISLPAIGQIMAADRSLDDIRAEAMRRYATELRRPVIEMSVKAAPLKIFVGGEVGNPGAYDMNGDGDALRAIVQAGNFKPGANMRKVIIIRRGAGGTAMMKTVDLGKTLRHGDQPDFVPLRRMDVVYVPRTGVANVALFMQQYFRDILPLPGSFSYAVNGYSVGN